MVWSKEKTITLIVEGEELKATFKVPTASEREEILPDVNDKFPKWSVLVKRFCTRVEGLGLVSVDELLEAPAGGDIVTIIGSQIILSSSLNVELKNA